MYSRISFRRICDTVVSVFTAIAARACLSCGDSRIPMVAIITTLLSLLHEKSKRSIVILRPTDFNTSIRVLYPCKRQCHWCSWINARPHNRGCKTVRRQAVRRCRLSSFQLEQTTPGSHTVSLSYLGTGRRHTAVRHHHRKSTVKSRQIRQFTV